MTFLIAGMFLVVTIVLLAVTTVLLYKKTGEAN